MLSMHRLGQRPETRSWLGAKQAVAPMEGEVQKAAPKGGIATCEEMF